MTIQDIPAQLAREFQQLGQGRPGDNAQPVATFTVKPWEAYTLTAVLQAASRHPALSDTQREVVLGFAHQVGDELVAMARAIIGPDNAIEMTIGMGFDPQFDLRPDEEWVCRGCGQSHGGLCEGCGQRHPACTCTLPVDEDANPEDFETLDDEEEEEPDSHVIGERRCRYVDPAVIRLSEREAEMELRQCAVCNRFFLQDTPLELFQDLGNQVVLGFWVCERCAPKVLAEMRGGQS